MGLFSLFFGRPRNAPSRKEMALLVEYANLVESVGPENLARGVAEARLPATKAQLMETIARLSLIPWSGAVLRPDDLPKLYGVLAFFFSPEELALVQRTREIGARASDGLDVSEEEEATRARGMTLLSEAYDRLTRALEDLRSHAASLGG